MTKAKIVALCIFVAAIANVALAVDINPGDNWQNKVDANPNGTIFNIKAGIHYGQTVIPKDGNQFIGESGAKMDGNGNAQAFKPPMSRYSTAKRYNVVIKNLEIYDYDPMFQHAVIHGNTGWEQYVSSVGWTIENCEIHHNDGAAIMIGDSFVVRNNTIHHQEQIGLVGGGTGSLVEGNEISYCNWTDKYDHEFEAGGSKFAHSTNIVVRDNYVHHNHGPGLWTDINNTGTLYEGNRVEFNHVFGIFHEISFACTIRCNIAIENGTNPGGWGWGAGIMVTNSENVHVYGNVVEIGASSGHGIVLNCQGRRNEVYLGVTTTYYLRNVFVHHNDITYQARRGSTGLNVDPGNADLVNTATIDFEYNTYHVPDTAVEVGGVWRYLWMWVDRGYGLAQWQSDGRDVNGGWDTDLSVSASFAGCGATCVLPTIVSEPSNQNITGGTEATFSVGAAGDAIEYQWQESSGSGWQNISGATSSSYSFTGTSSDNGNWYRCRLSNTCGAPAYSWHAVLGVCSPLTYTSGPTDQNVESGNAATFSVSATGAAIEYRWERENGSTWDSVASTNAYSFTAYQEDDGERYRCILSSLCSSPVTSDTATLSVWTPAACTAVTITSPASWTSFSAIAGEVETLTVVATGQEPMEYRWQTRPYPSTNPWQDLPNGNQITYLLLVNETHEYDDFRCIVSNGCGPAEASATLHLEAVCVPPSITRQPENKIALVGDTVRFSIDAIGTNRGYTWDADSGGGWYSTGVVNDSTFTFSPVMEHQAGRKLRCIATADCGDPDTSKVATLTIIFLPPTITTHPESQSIYENEVVTFAVAAVGDGLRYKWERDKGQGWNIFQGETSPSYSRTVVKTDHGHRFRAIVTSDHGFDPDTSNAAVLTVLFAEAPSNLSYSENPAVYQVNQPIQPNQPSVSGNVTSYSVSPQLPAGLLLDTTTGFITGVPTALAPKAQYVVTASNNEGVTSVTLSIEVAVSSDSDAPDNKTELTASAVSHSSIELRWTTPESNAPDADTVWVYYRIGGNPYPGGGQNTLVAKSGITSSGTPQAVTLTSLAEQTQYFFALWISDTAGNVSAAKVATATTSALNAVSNPLVVRGQRINSTHVELTLSGFMPIPSTKDPLNPYADTIGIWYSSTTMPGYPNPTAPMQIKLGLQETQSHGDPHVFQATVPELTGADSLYFFAPSLYWRVPQQGDSLPLFIAGNGDSVLMRHAVSVDSTPVPFNLAFADAVYDDVDTVVDIPIVNTSYIDAKAESLLVWYDYTPAPDFQDDARVVSVPVATASASDPYMHSIKDPFFAATEQMVYFAIALRGENGLLSAHVLDSVMVAPTRPTNNTKLRASNVGAQQVTLTWSPKDSVRIWQGTIPVPLTHDVPSPPFVAILPSSTDETIVVKTLDPNTEIHFGLQIFRLGQWSTVTESSSVSIITYPLTPTHTIANAAVVDNLIFDPTTNRIVVSVSVDTTLQPWSDSLQLGLGYSLLGYPTKESGLQVIELAGLDTTVALILNEAITFDTTYYVGAFLRELGTEWVAPTAAARDTVGTEDFSSQPVTYFAGSDTLVLAFNGNVLLKKSPEFNGTLNDTLYVVDVAGSLPVGLVSAGLSFSFGRGSSSAPGYWVGIRHSPLLAAPVREEVALYRIDSVGGVHVVHGSYVEDGVVWAKLSPGTDTYAALADTVGPVANTTRGTDTTLAAAYSRGDSFLDTIYVNDEVDNVRWQVLVAEGGAGGPLGLVDSGVLTSGRNMIVAQIGYHNISTVSGAMAFVVLDDGVHRDTLNISRQVVRKGADVHTIPQALKWYPVFASADLNSKEPQTVLTHFTHGSGSAWYEETDFRLLRWLRGTWVEYSLSKHSEFHFTPGRVVWMCVAKEEAFNLGNGKTSDLRNPFEITVPAKDWVDIGLPYQFEVYIEDAFAASDSAARQLYFYSWKDGSVYSASALHVPGMPGRENPRATFVGGALSAYAVYNPTETAITLKIPPRPSKLSTVGIQKATRESDEGWAVVLSPTAKSNGANEVICAYRGAETDVHLPVAPSFGGIRASVIDEDGSMHGGICEHALTNGGATYYVSFTNNGARRTSAEYVVEVGGDMRDNVDFVILGADLSQSFDGTRSLLAVDVPAGETVTHVLLVGSSDYVHQATTAFSVPRAGPLRASPNPFGSVITIRYRLPFKELRSYTLAAYNAAGKNVWEHTKRSSLSPGSTGIAHWRPGSNGSRALSGGVYLVRLTVETSQGRRFTIAEQRVTYVP